MNRHAYFLGKKEEKNVKKNIISLSSAQLDQKVVNVKIDTKIRYISDECRLRSQADLSTLVAFVMW